MATNYSDLKARYNFTAEGNVSTQIVKLPPPVNKADPYLEVSSNQGGQLAPGAITGTIRYRTSKPDAGRFNQANDYSYQEPNGSGGVRRVRRIATGEGTG